MQGLKKMLTLHVTCIYTHMYYTYKQCLCECRLYF